MPVIPVVCKNGHIYSSGIDISNGRNITFKNVAIKCPICGQMGLVPDGTYNFFENSIKFLSGPDVSNEELTKLKKAIVKFKKANGDFADLPSIIANEAPAFNSLLSILPSNKDQLYAFLSLIVAIIALLNSGTPANPEAILNDFSTKTEIINNMNFDTSNNYFKHSLFKNAAKNRPCPCGSGKLFKRCHGLR